MKRSTVFVFDTEEERQAFLNWVTGPSEPSEGLNNLKRLIA